MAKRTVPCRVCGKPFVPCNKASDSLGAFNYHSVACSPECGIEYLHRVQEARQKPSTAPNAIASTDDKKETDNNAPKRNRGRRQLIKPIDEYAGEN